MNLNELADRVEAAEGADESLDLEIARIQRVVCLRRNIDDTGNEEFTHWRYTASIDAAMTLVPDGWSVQIFTSEDKPDCEIHIAIKLGRSYPTNKIVYAEHSGKNSFKCVALALCAAVLRARASMEAPHED